ncbi:MAG: RidA family protein [Sedimentibacter sp.]|uniref:RidA family protein n=1 Tax=Sedimentibacter sp. TaxID=1960295 RepID=UPI003159454E
MKIAIKTQHAPGAIGPYSQAVACNGMIYVSGQLPIDSESGTIAEGVESQARQSLKNIKAILEAGDFNLSDVVKTTVFLKDINDFSVMNKVYGSFFEEPYPARAAVEVARLPKDVKVEIEAIAVK